MGASRIASIELSWRWHRSAKKYFYHLLTYFMINKQPDKELYKKNRLIAGFHGWQIDLVTSPDDPWCYDPGSSEELHKLAEEYHMLFSSQLKYHESWDWLMPIVEKIEAMGHAVEILENSCRIYEHSDRRSLNTIISITGGTKIYATYENVIQFILLYNKSKMDEADR